MGMDHHQLKPLLCLSTLAFFLLITTAAAGDDDTAVMQKLATAVKPTKPDWTSTANHSFCRWLEVTCDSSNRVTSIDLSNNFLAGVLPSDLNSLSHLTSLFLSGNSFSGPMPSFANLTFLQTLHLDVNNFASIPPGSFQGLPSLHTLNLTLNMNLAPWSFPTELTQSPNLVNLYVASANIVGSLPDIFHAFPSLQDLDLSHNDLTGVLPESLAGAPIRNLHLNDQLYGFSGPIDLLSSMANLTQVWLQKNRFTGQIPDLSKCQNLTDLQLRDNQFTGLVPPSLMQLSSLLNVSLDNNLLQGPIPVFHSSVSASFGGVNSFCRETPGPCDPQVSTILQIAGAVGYPVLLADAWKGNDACRYYWYFIFCNGTDKITTLNIGSFNLEGTISPAFGNLTFLKHLYLNDNNLTGEIPESLTTLPFLQHLDVSNNNLTGKIPNFGPLVELNIKGNPLLKRSLSLGNGGKN